MYICVKRFREESVQSTKSYAGRRGKLLKSLESVMKPGKNFAADFYIMNPRADVPFGVPTVCPAKLPEFGQKVQKK